MSVKLNNFCKSLLNITTILWQSITTIFVSYWTGLLFCCCSNLGWE